MREEEGRGKEKEKEKEKEKDDQVVLTMKFPLYAEPDAFSQNTEKTHETTFGFLFFLLFFWSFVWVGGLWAEN